MVDKYGLGMLLLGILMLLGMFYFVFGFSVPGLINAVIVTIEGGLVLLSLLLIFMGLVLLVY